MTETTPAIQEATGRRLSKPTRPEEPPGPAEAGHTGEGQEAARKINARIWEREANNHYVEPSWVPRRLFEVEQFRGTVMDPCCGFGQIPKAGKAAGLEVYGCDLIDRGFDYLAVCDFLKSDVRADNYVFNPPFELADQFAMRALRLASRKVAMIFPTARLNAAKWIAGTPLYRVYYLTPRPSMPPGHVFRDLEQKGKAASGGTADFCILVWLIGYDGDATIHWLHRDKPSDSIPSFTDRPFGAPL